MIALAGVIVALVFNTTGVWLQYLQSKHQTAQAADSDVYTRLNVLTNLAGEARDSEAVVDNSRMLEFACDRDYLRQDLSVRDEAELRRALAIYDYMAWVFADNTLHFNDSGHGLHSAEIQWTPRLVNAAEMGRRLLSRTEVRLEWRELDRFAKPSFHRKWVTDHCPEDPKLVR